MARKGHIPGTHSFLWLLSSTLQLLSSHYTTTNNIGIMVFYKIYSSIVQRTCINSAQPAQNGVGFLDGISVEY